MIPRIQHLLLGIAAMLLPVLQAPGETLNNETYRIQLGEDGTVAIAAAQGKPERLTPTFTVLFSARVPGYHRNNSNYLLAPRTSLRWEKYQQPIEELNRWLKEEMELAVRVTEDVKGTRTWDYGSGRLKLRGQYAQGTTNPFLVGERYDLVPAKSFLDGRTIRWEFAPCSGFTFAAELVLNTGAKDPEIRYVLKAAKPGYYTVVFTGVPGIEEKRSIAVPQQAAGNNARTFNHVVAEVNEKLPRTHISDGRRNFLVVAHPDEVPFREKMIDYMTSRFGTMIRKERGVLYPLIFAPVMGAESSRMQAGESRGFKLFFVSRSGDWQNSYRYVAEKIYDLRDLRDNSGAGSLNVTIARLMDYLGNRNGKNHAMWHAEQKYYNYWSDKSGIFKPFSPLFGMSAAIVLDDEDFYRCRVLPAVEFALSRMNNVFSPYDVKDTGQVHSKDRRLGGPYVSLPQLVSLWEFYQNRTFALRFYAEQETGTGRSSDLLAAWKLNGDGAKLEAAVTACEKELKVGKGGYMDFLELYEATGKTKFLEATQVRVYERLSHDVNLFPRVPAEDMIFDRGGQVPVHAHSFGRHQAWGFPPPQGLASREQKAPAWRGSEIGLESFSHHRAELWPNHPPQILRTAAYSGDSFLRTVARWGLVGRYANYAGDNRTERSLVTEKPDAPEHPIWKLTYSSINPGHAWEFVGGLVNFLVTDCFDRSARQIHFPGLTLAGSFFRVQAFGALPGSFYDEKNVRLWCPSDLLIVDNPQIDWLAGWGNGKLYLAFWNQSFQDEQVTVKLNKQRVIVPERALMRLWENNQPVGTKPCSGSKLAFRLPAKGILAFAIDRVETRKTLQGKMFDPTGPVLGPSSLKTLQTPFGKVHGMLLSMGRGLINAFVYTDALPENVLSARLRYRQGGGAWQCLQDDIFPFEFSIWLDDTAGNFESIFEVETSHFEKQESATLILDLHSGTAKDK